MPCPSLEGTSKLLTFPNTQGIKRCIKLFTQGIVLNCYFGGMFLVLFIIIINYCAIKYVENKLQCQEGTFGQANFPRRKIRNCHRIDKSKQTKKREKYQNLRKSSQTQKRKLQAKGRCNLHLETKSQKQAAHKNMS